MNKNTPQDEKERVLKSLPEEFFMFLQKDIKVKDPETGEEILRKPLVFFPASNLSIQARDSSDISEP